MTKGRDIYFYMAIFNAFVAGFAVAKGNPLGLLIGTIGCLTSCASTSRRTV